MVNILTCCASGAGTSLMMSVTLEKVIKAMGLNATATHLNITEGVARATEFDVILCSASFAGRFAEAESQGVKVIPLSNVLSTKEIKEKLAQSGLDFS